ncbi:MAG: hypothetical protein V1944_00950 [Candidatus Aenigmatarchaeota archaeon]
MQEYLYTDESQVKMMSIPGILGRSLREGFLSKKFIPLFSLYFLFSALLLTFINPVLKILPDILSLEFTKFSLAVVGITFTTLIILFLIVLFINIWFVGALTFQAYSNKSFRSSLKKSQQVYWRLVCMSLLAILIGIITSQLSTPGNILRIIFDLILFFVIPGIIIKNYSLLSSMKKSFELFRKNILKTVIFWFILFLILILVFFTLAFLVAALATPVLMSSLSSISSLDTFTDKQIWTQVVGVILENYPLLYMLSIVISYFLAGAYTSYIFARTHFYLELLKKRKQ